MGAADFDDLSLGYPNERKTFRRRSCSSPAGYDQHGKQFGQSGVVRAYAPVASPESPECALFGVTIAENPELYKKASPRCW
jgi:hypothetical protein